MNILGSEPDRSKMREGAGGVQINVDNQNYINIILFACTCELVSPLFSEYGGWGGGVQTTGTPPGTHLRA